MGIWVVDQDIERAVMVTGVFIEPQPNADGMRQIIAIGGAPLGRVFYMPE